VTVQSGAAGSRRAGPPSGSDPRVLAQSRAADPLRERMLRPKSSLPRCPSQPSLCSAGAKSREPVTRSSPWLSATSLAGPPR